MAFSKGKKSCVTFFEKFRQVDKFNLANFSNVRRTTEAMNVIEREMNGLKSSLSLSSLYHQWFRDEVSKEEDMPDELLALMFAHIDPIYELHCGFLKDIEQRMAAW